MIKEAVMENGRVALIELPNILNIGSNIIEARAEMIVKRGELMNVV